jgi:hypothetical protein
VAVCLAALVGCLRRDDPPPAPAHGDLLPWPISAQVQRGVRTAVVDGRSVERDVTTDVAWRIVADRDGGTLLERAEGMRVERWYRAPGQLAVATAGGWFAVQGPAPGLPVELPGGPVASWSAGSGEGTSAPPDPPGCVTVRRIEATPEGSADPLAAGSIEESRTLCPGRGEVRRTRTVRGAVGTLRETWRSSETGP